MIERTSGSRSGVPYLNHFFFIFFCTLLLLSEFKTLSVTNVELKIFSNFTQALLAFR